MADGTYKIGLARESVLTETLTETELAGGNPTRELHSTLGTSVLRVLLVDDQTLFRTGLSRLLGDDPRVEIVGQARDGKEALEQAERLKPDVVLMDLKMPNMDGIEATRHMIAADPSAKILILTTFETDDQVTQALGAGAAGYVLKDSKIEGIVSSLLSVASGERVMSSAVAKRMLDMINGTSSSKDEYDGLTKREVEILRLLAEGKANKQIAYLLGISDKTVRNHVSHLYEKLHICDRSQVVLYAIRKGLIEA